MAVRELGPALAVLAEALVQSRRVILIGADEGPTEEALLELGARQVYAVNDALPEGDFDVRDGAFDLALVPDLAAARDPALLLARLRRVVGRDGVVLCAAAQPGMGYYELYDIVSLQFAHVRMMAVMSFHGLTFAELGPAEVDVAVRVDTQLVGDRPPPGAFVALVSQRDVALDAYAVLELRATNDAPRLRQVEGERDVALASQAKLADQVGAARLHTASLETSVALQHTRIQELEAKLAEQVREPPAADDADVVELEGKLKERAATIAALEAELTRRDKMIRELVSRLEEGHDGTLTRKLDELARLAAKQRSDLEAQAWRISELEGKSQH